MTNIFISPGNETHLARIQDYLNHQVCGILLHREAHKGELLGSLSLSKGLEEKVYTFRSLLRPVPSRLSERDLLSYGDWLNHVLGDARAHYLATRSYFNSPFNNAVTIEKILVNSILIIRQTNPDILVSSATPHSIEAWVFAKCFEYLQLPVYVLEATPNVHRLWVRRGLDQQHVVSPAEVEPADGLSASSLKLIREQRDSKPGQKDDSGLEVSRMHMSTVAGSKSNQWWSWRRELARLRSGRLRSLPLRTLSMFFKRSLYKSYQAAAISDLPKNPYVVFFMHYQPERTSLPEGLFFVQQWIAVRLMAWSLPKGWSLLVREHPTTWLDPLDISVRTKNLYSEMASMDQTEICSMDLDTFELIDGSQAVATLTGSVGFQALARGKPVLALGVASYRDHPACFPIEGYEDLVNALDAIQEPDFSGRIGDRAIEDYLQWVEKNSVSADPDEPDRLEARLKNFAEIYRQILSGEIDLK